MKRLLFTLFCFATLAQAQIPTNKREIMQQFLSGTLDEEYVPAAFFMHFGKDARIGEKAIDAHLRYFLSTGMDFVKSSLNKDTDVYGLINQKIGNK